MLRLCSKKKTFIVSLVFSLDFLSLITVKLEYTFLYNMTRSGRIHYSSKVTYVTRLGFLIALQVAPERLGN